MVPSRAGDGRRVWRMTHIPWWNTGSKATRTLIATWIGSKRYACSRVVDLGSFSRAARAGHRPARGDQAGRSHGAGTRRAPAASVHAWRVAHRCRHPLLREMQAHRAPRRGSPLRGRADAVAGSGTLRISTSVAFGRRVLAPMVLDFMRDHALLTVDLSFDDRYVNLVEQGVDVAVRMGRLADSSLGATYLGNNPWVVVASAAYLERRGAPVRPSAGRSRGAGLQHRAGRRHLAFRRRRRADPGHSGEGTAALEQPVRAAGRRPRRFRHRRAATLCGRRRPAPRGHPAAAGGLAPARPGDPRGVSVAAHGAGKVRELVAWLKGRFRDEWWRADVRGAMSHEQSR